MFGRLRNKRLQVFGASFNRLLDRHDTGKGLVDGDEAPIVDGMEPFEDFLEVDSTLVPDTDVIEGNAASRPGPEAALPARMKSEVQHVNIEDVRYGAIGRIRSSVPFSRSTEIRSIECGLGLESASFRFVYHSFRTGFASRKRDSSSPTR